MKCDRCERRVVEFLDFDRGVIPFLSALWVRVCPWCGAVGRPSPAMVWGVLALIGSVPAAFWIGTLAVGGWPRNIEEALTAACVAGAVALPLMIGVWHTGRFVPDEPGPHDGLQNRP